MMTGLSQAYALKPSSEFETIMPIVSLAQPIPFIKEKVDWLLSQNVETMGFKYGSSGFGPRIISGIELIRNYDEIEEREMWIHVTNMGKTMKNLSRPHISVLANIDTISTYKFHPKVVRYLASVNQTKTKEQAKWNVPPEPDKKIIVKSDQKRIVTPRGHWLKGSELSYLTDTEHVNSLNHGERCPCPFHKKNYSIKELKNLIGSDGRAQLLQVHDMFTSNNEFNEIQKAISDNSLIGYYRTKAKVLEEKGEIKKRFKTEL